MATVQFDSSVFSPGFAGIINNTTDPTRIRGASVRTAWCGYITGTEAVLTATRSTGPADGMVEVSIDGGAYATASRSGTAYTLFTGLSEATRFVVIRYGAIFSTTPYVNATGDVLSVTGDAPAIAPFGNWARLRDGGSLTIYSAMTAAAPTDFTPAYVAAQSHSSAGGSNIAAIKLRGAFNRIAVASDTPAIYISKNGAAPVKYDRPGGISFIYGFLSDALGGDLATYYVWNAAQSSTTLGQFSVSGDAVLQDCGIKRRLDQYGDSITQGAGGGTWGDVETMRVAAAMGFIGSTSGVAGQTVAECSAFMDTVLPGRVITGDDVAVLAIGRNDVSGLDQTEYESCINKLVAAGYGTILCRGILPEGAETWVTPNGVIQAAIAAVDNPNVLFIDTSSWAGIETADGVHPTPTGYVTIAGYAQPAYMLALGIPTELVVADVGIGLALDSINFAGSASLEVGDSSLALSIDALDLVQANLLVVADAAVGVLVDEVALTASELLVMASLDIASSIEQVALVQANLLAINDLSAGISADAVALVLDSAIVVADSALSVSIDSVVVDQSNLLVVASLDLAISADSPVLLQQNALSVNDIQLSILMDSMTIGGGVFVTESALGFMVRDFQYVLLVEA